LKKNKYDICHTHFIIPTGVLALKIKKKFGLEYIITAHGSDVLGYNPRFKNLYPLLIKKWKSILDNAKKITTPSNFLKDEILKIYKEINKNKIEVIPNGIEEGKFKPMKKEKYILLVSRLFVNKGIQDLFEAVKDIDLKEWTIKIAGDGPYRKNLENLVEKYNLKNKIEFLGWIDNKSEQMKELYGKASIFILPSYFENMNVTLLEALQSGCNVIASDAGGNKEIVGEDSLFPAKDIKKLKLKIKNNLNNINTDSSKFNISNFYLNNIIYKYSNLLK